MALQPETLEQIAVMNWLRAQHPKLVPLTMHIPNERKCSQAHGYILKKMGLLPGASDLFIAHARGGYHGMFIEIKTLKGSLTPNQVNFLENMNAQKYFATCEKGFEAIVARINWYLSLPDSLN